MNIGITEIGKALGTNGNAKNMQPAKYFYISRDTGEISRPFDTKEAAAEAVAALITANDKTGETYYVVEVVQALQSARAVAKENFTPAKRK